MNGSPFYLVSCVGKKRAAPTPARDLYISEWFTRARKLVEATGSNWFILSARFGLVSPEQIIAPYDATLNHMPIAARRAWAADVLKQLDRALPAGGRCVVLAGSRYREFLLDFLVGRYDVDVPMRGLAIGQQLRWLGQAERSIREGGELPGSPPGP
ncbi:DUF6884 domain-containing protein [Burkholderia pseudomallei]|uniref:DUF6884 domain-containing protein n=1 Tax=Burkholderia pseudomallei TaxID=28450 RepID=UPI000A1A20F9|nr:DUF6884 domain-containing protein [Burkholderia pseudomallei]ARL04257.1 hypothetical protein BOC44_21035 [Burkholderia pseudomallei]